MKLLILTQAVDLDDPILGFFHRWIEEFAKHSEEVTVVCLRKGRFELPHNVSIFSLGKEEGKGRVVRLIRFFRYIVSLRNRYSSVFVHMNPEYILIGGLVWRLWGKRIGLWYTHKSVTLYLRIAIMIAHRIYTATPKSFRLRSRKLLVTGHGIPIGEPVSEQKNIAGPLRLLVLGRIAPVKNIEAVFAAGKELNLRGVRVEISIVGESAEKDRLYEKGLRNEAERLPYPVSFAGSMSHGNLASVFKGADMLINTSTTGSADKSVLEAAAHSLRVVTCNEGYEGVLPRPWLAQSCASPALADAIMSAWKADPGDLRSLVVRDHSLSNTVMAIIAGLEGNNEQ